MDSDTIEIRNGEWGFSGLSVQVHTDTGSVGPFAVGSQGEWEITVAGATAGDPVVVEFLGWPDWMSSGPFNGSGATINRTSVVHTVVGDCNVDFAVATPSDHCSDNPTLSFGCFTQNGSDAVLADITYDQGYPFVFQPSGDNPDNAMAIGSPPYNHYNHGAWEDFLPPLPTKGTRATLDEIGTIFGVAADPRRGVIYSSAFYSNNRPIGAAGFGAIYRDNVLWLDLASAPASQTVALPADCDYGAGTVQCKNDVGFMGLGDLEINDTWSELYVVNLASQDVLAIPIDASGNPESSLLRVYDAPEPSRCGSDNPGGPSRTRAPFGLAYHEGRLYVGVVCTDPGSSADGPHGYVFSFDPTVAPGSETYAEEVAIDLVYDKHQGRYVSGETWEAPHTWDDWGARDRAFNDIATVAEQAFVHPQIVDIEFDIRVDGTDDMTLAVRNRSHDIFSFANEVNGLAMMRFCEQTPDARDWLAGSRGGGGSGSCDDLIATTRHDPPYEPDTPSFYHDFFREGFGVSGGIAQVPGFTEIVGMSMDNIHEAANSGISWLANDNGERSRDTLLIGSLPFVSGFNKANNWGDVEALCPTPTVEIGNLVWIDADADGLQDPSETLVGNVTLDLYVDTNGNGQLEAGELALMPFATTTTDGNGHYLFTSTAHGLAFGTSYIVTVAASNFSSGPLVGLVPTTSNASSDTRNSDGQIKTQSIPEVGVVVGAPGQNDHTWDFGFRAPVMPPVLSLGNRVWRDDGTGGGGINNGVQDGLEAGIGGVVLELFDSNGPVDQGSGPLTATTDASGHYLFDSLSAGDYRVCVAASNFATGGPLANLLSSTVNEADPDADIDRNDNGADSLVPTSLGSCSGFVTLALGSEPIGESDVGALGSGLAQNEDSNLTVDFGFYPPLSLGNVVWFDLDNSGSQETGELGIGGVLLTLCDGQQNPILGSNGQPLTATTDANGVYLFDGADGRHLRSQGGPEQFCHRWSTVRGH